MRLRSYEMPFNSDSSFWASLSFMTRRPFRTAADLDRLTEREFYFVNTHFDHRGEIARVNSVDLIIQKVRELADLSEAVVISGDFNLPPKSEAIRKMSAAFNDTYTTSDHPPMGPTTTFTSFDINKEGGNRIDYIFTNDKIQTSKTAILSHWIDGHFNSDHFPVLSYFDIK